MTEKTRFCDECSVWTPHKVCTLCGKKTIEPTQLILPPDTTAACVIIGEYEVLIRRDLRTNKLNAHQKF